MNKYSFSIKHKWIIYCTKIYFISSKNPFYIEQKSILYRAFNSHPLKNIYFKFQKIQIPSKWFQISPKFISHIFFSQNQSKVLEFLHTHIVLQKRSIWLRLKKVFFHVLSSVIMKSAPNPKARNIRLVLLVFSVPWSFEIRSKVFSDSSISLFCNRNLS